jgi:hypothetical protein
VSPFEQEETKLEIAISLEFRSVWSFPTRQACGMLTRDLSIGKYFVNEFSAFQIECQGCSMELFLKTIIECDLFYRSLLFGLG